MAVDRLDVQKKIKQRFGRDATEQDYANVEKSGLGVIDKQFATPTQAPQTAQQAGQQEAIPTDLAGQINYTRNKRNEAVAGKGPMLNVLSKALQAKVDRDAPYEERKSDIAGQIMEIPERRIYKNLTPQDARIARANDISYLQNEINFLNNQQE